MGMWMSRQGAVDRLGPTRLGLLALCVNEAWGVWEKTIRPCLPVCSPVGLANIMHELMAEQARHRLTEDLGFRLRDYPRGVDRFLVTVDDRVLLQFRKLTNDFVTRNNPTEMSVSFDKQEPGLGELPDLPRLTVGYQLGQYRTSIAGQYLAFISGKTCIWHHDLLTGEHSITLDFPAAAGPSPAEQEAEEERRRKQDDDQEEKGAE